MASGLADGVIVDPKTIETVRAEISEWVNRKFVCLQIWSEREENWVEQQHGEKPPAWLTSEDVVAKYDSLIIANCWPVPSSSLLTIDGDVMTVLTTNDRLVRFVRWQ